MPTNGNWGHSVAQFVDMLVPKLPELTEIARVIVIMLASFCTTSRRSHDVTT